MHTNEASSEEMRGIPALKLQQLSFFSIKGKDLFFPKYLQRAAIQIHNI